MVGPAGSVSVHCPARWVVHAVHVDNSTRPVFVFGSHPPDNPHAMNTPNFLLLFHFHVLYDVFAMSACSTQTCITAVILFCRGSIIMSQKQQRRLVNMCVNWGEPEQTPH